ncbi:MAG: YncE family protein, partial [Candidatus Krumholzibacteria bacterium]|nr:YncE family protein [Candidatus Krumholzibacteria bacterium]
PRQALDFNSTYVIEITSGLEDESGDTLVTPMSVNFDTDQNPSPLDLSSVQPISATKGVKLVLAGKGFDKIASNNTVFFGDVPAAPTKASVDFLKVVVPPGATTDLIRVKVGTDTSNALPFAVLVPSNTTSDDVIGNLKGASPTRGVAITPDGTLAYAVSPNAGAVIPIDVQGLGTVKYPSIQVGSKPYAVVIHPEGDFAYVVNRASGSMSIIDVGTNLVVKTLLVGNKPVDLVVSPDGDRVYVANFGSKTVSEIDTDESSKTHHKVLANMSPGATTRSISITPDGTRLYVGTNTGYVILDPIKHSVIGNLSGAQATRSISITPDGTLVIVLTVNGNVLIVDGQPGSPTENTVIGNLGAGSSTRSISIT